ncbi:beta-galactosidase BoGH2A precursor [mine drainage metagenome]|uniref:Beta-galactosidase BoGH2A n=1 Tax=mine drainage metagenome TaxID=410659 RepID=A0A1J5SHF5_9ZZZZ
MKHFFQIFFIIFFIHQMTFAQNKNIERKQLFDYNWKFFLGDASAASEKNFNDADWRKLDLPHDWSIEGTVNPDNPSKGAGGYFPTGIGWYRKTFLVPADWKDKSISVYFEGAYMNAEVFINGKSLGVHPYGYTSFYYHLSPYLEYGKGNLIAVKIDNAQQLNSRWYSGSGIYRHVWMMVTNPVHIAQWGVTITAPDVSAKQATVQIKTVIKNETPATQFISINTNLFNNNLKNTGNNQIKIELTANSEKEFIQNIVVKNPSLWWPGEPNLYQAQIQLKKNKSVLDETNTNFGIRTIKFSTENGFQLNGKSIKINGGCVHHDNGCLGSAAYDRAEERKIELLKAAGFNAVRTSHNPPSEVFLNACDRLGLLVIDESFDCWRIGKNSNDYAKYFDAWWKKDLQAMVLRDRNHPSIIMWSIGNEIVERGKPEAVVTAKMLYNEVKAMDTTRPVTSAVVNFDKWENTDALFAVHDVAGNNYHLYAAPTDHLRVPSRIFVQTESYPKDAFPNWKLVQENNYVIGDFVWTAIDYLGEAGIGRTYYTGETPGENWDNDMFPWHGSYCGDIDLIGTRKPISHYRSMLYNNNEKLFLAVREPNPEPLKIKETWWSVWPTFESWNWQGFEGKKMQVEVYSKYQKVRLYLNNNLIGEQNTSQENECKATFSVPYSAGILKAAGIENDKEVETKILQTAGDAAKVKLSADRKKLVANGQDLCFVAIDITDKEGILQPNAANRLQFKIEGEGTIAGVANADMKDYDSYVGSSRKVWHGKALVVIKATHKAGEIKLTVTGDGLEMGDLLINSER